MAGLVLGILATLVGVLVIAVFQEATDQLGRLDQQLGARAGEMTIFVIIPRSHSFTLSAFTRGNSGSLPSRKSKD